MDEDDNGKFRLERVKNDYRGLRVNWCTPFIELFFSSLQEKLAKDAAEGWEYAPLFNMKFHHIERKMDLVRRRRWHRKMVADSHNAPCFFALNASEVGTWLLGPANTRRLPQHCTNTGCTSRVSWGLTTVLANTRRSSYVPLELEGDNLPLCQLAPNGRNVLFGTLSWNSIGSMPRVCKQRTFTTDFFTGFHASDHLSKLLVFFLKYINILVSMYCTLWKKH